MNKFSINQSGNLQCDIGDNLRISNIRGFYEKQISEDDFIVGIIAEERFGMILCERIKPEPKDESTNDDFYDEYDEENQLEIEISNSYWNFFYDFVAVALAIATAYGFYRLVNYLTILFFGHE